MKWIELDWIELKAINFFTLSLPPETNDETNNNKMKRHVECVCVCVF